MPQSPNSTLKPGYILGVLTSSQLDNEIVAVAGNAPLSATSGSIGGTLMAAGTQVSANVAVSGASNSMGVVVTPTVNPGIVAWHGVVVAPSIVTVYLTNPTGGNVTPTATAYNIRVIQ